ncbi:hypothetical protein I7I50_01681 [Histoplasma capsulatum G186AR]|uniref:Uncharacterized protein n=1 Tax=Ajellomyces capsulatus TaxID=5037 RepID=A0A8H7YF35_AJECA|nr:hypothetical protein I7I52_11897 [Histoplasma capsulatum]QSS70995.1 hypothetical protein I7I50_01681 [Histoplasma capsulatum G186AR]
MINTHSDLICQTFLLRADDYAVSSIWKMLVLNVSFKNTLGLCVGIRATIGLRRISNVYLKSTTKRS